MDRENNTKVNEIYALFRRNFPYVRRAEHTAKRIISHKDNILFEERDAGGKLTGCGIVNRNTVLLLVVDAECRGKGIGSSLLHKCEKVIADAGYDKAVLGAGFDYLMPGVPTSRRYAPAVHEELDSRVNDKASAFFEKRGYSHAWGQCSCFDMRRSLADAEDCDYSVGCTVHNVIYRFAVPADLPGIIACADDACQYQDERFSKYYRNSALYETGGKDRVLVAEKDGTVIGCLIVSAGTEGEGFGSVGCTCVASGETRQGIGTAMIRTGTAYLKSIGMKEAGLGYTYSGPDKMYGAAGYRICTYYMMGEKQLRQPDDAGYANDHR